MAKTKITKSKIPILKRDLEIEDEVLKKLGVEQNRYKTKFKTRLEAVKTDSLKRYNAKIETLTKTKTESMKAFDEDIKRYKALVKDLGGTERKTPTKQKVSVKRKAPNKPK